MRIPKSLLALTACAALAAGCSSTNGSSTSTSGSTKSSGGASSSGATMTFWNGFTASDRQFVEQIVNGYNSSSKNKVNMTIEPWDTIYQKLQTSLPTGQGPDMPALDPSLAAAYVTDGTLHAVSFEPLLEQRMLEHVRQTEHGAVLALEPDLAQRLLVGIAQLATAAENQGHRPVLACAPQLRPAVRRFVAPAVPRLPVLSYTELGTARQVRSVGIVGEATEPALAVGVA